MKIALPDGSGVSVHKCELRFDLWTGERPWDSHNKRKHGFVDCDGEPLYAELAILHRLRSAGWQGAWVDSYRRGPGGVAFRTGRMAHGQDHSQTIKPPPDQKRLYNRIAEQKRRSDIAMGRKASTGGCWDVYAWRGSDVLFAEAKRRGADEVRPTQQAWLAAALAQGIPLSSFVLVEWEPTNPAR